MKVSEGYAFVFMIAKFLFYIFKKFICVSKNVKFAIIKVKMTYVCVIQLIIELTKERKYHD